MSNLYKLVYKNLNEEVDISLNIEDVNSSNMEIYYIDRFTLTFKSEDDCTNYLKGIGCIGSCDGSLMIKKPNGKKEVLPILYNDLNMRVLCKEVCTKKNNKKSLTLSETREFKEEAYKLLKFFLDDKQKYDILCKTYFDSLNLVKCLGSYLEYKNHGSFYTLAEISHREKCKTEFIKILKKYETLRSLKMWVASYDKYKNIKNKKNYSSKYINPFEQYERRLDEDEEKNYYKQV